MTCWPGADPSVRYVGAAVTRIPLGQPNLPLPFFRQTLVFRPYPADQVILAGDYLPLCCYAVSESAASTIVDIAATLGVSRLILGAPKRNTLVNILRGNVVREVSDLLPEEIDLIVYA